jgi:hypothetical protein
MNKLLKERKINIEDFRCEIAHWWYQKNIKERTLDQLVQRIFKIKKGKK